MARENRLSPREVHEVIQQPFGFRAARYSHRGSARGRCGPKLLVDRFLVIAISFSLAL
jgi:hypothetical protein